MKKALTGKRKLLIVAHRGAKEEAPENTRSAFDAALKYPVDGIEFDVRITREGIPVIHHDKTLSRITGSRRKIESCFFGEIADSDWGSWFSKKYSKERILTFEKTIELYCRRTRLFVEIKTDEEYSLSETSRVLTLKVLEIIKKKVPHKYSGGIYILCFNPKLLEFAYNKAQAYKYVYNLSGSSLKQASYPSYIHGLCLPIGKLSSSFMDKANKGGYSVLTYSCNTREQAARALDLGATVIMTDYPGKLCGYLKREI
ncbi:MAG: hypothetical protein KKD92_11600 [Proteobacteria bacterium]|nr:hypothetical protein [Pseudomonadota bacterium]MBU2622950.1 hypothetical protein [Pseudomonadota bacterium]OQW98504.1 MAG: hypothetical protein BWK74_04410 [Desulfobacteraceae bacterium A6]